MDHWQAAARGLRLPGWRGTHSHLPPALGLSRVLQAACATVAVIRRGPCSTAAAKGHGSMHQMRPLSRFQTRTKALDMGVQRATVVSRLLSGMVQIIKKQLAEGVSTRRVGLVSSGAPARQHSEILDADGKQVPGAGRVHACMHACMPSAVRAGLSS